MKMIEEKDFLRSHPVKNPVFFYNCDTPGRNQMPQEKYTVWLSVFVY